MTLRHLMIFAWSLWSICALNAQNGALDQYIQQALSSNIALQEKNLSYEKSLEALKEAKALFLPQLALNARYSVAQGGRTIDFPIGDLLNPVYQNLNTINSLEQAMHPDYPTIPEYPTLSNEQINFLRPTEQETRLSLVMPVFNTAIIQNQRIRENLVAAAEISVTAYQRELVKEVKVAYFNHAQAVQGVQIWENALELVEENLRTTESLHRNNKVTLDVVYAAKAEVSEVEQQLADAQKQRNMAQAYFNFLLNRDYNAVIEMEDSYAVETAWLPLDEARQRALDQREELQQMQLYLSTADRQIEVQKGAFMPTLNLAVDYGIQGTNYKLDKDADYFMGSLVFQWNLFNRADKARVQQSKIEQLELSKQLEMLQQQIALQTTNAWYEMEAAQKRITQGQQEVEAAEQAFRLLQKKFSQGQANLIEFTNARTQLTNAQLSLSLAQFGLQQKMAILDWAVGE
ncbi:MAG TPA: TolC family protein [Saprospiraceae bacterium]|nr:TolC family protein [Saprospiraceae bacterium]HMQ83500.1 TolC family protein [Saprospiraceae bacterium]